MREPADAVLRAPRERHSEATESLDGTVVVYTAISPGYDELKDPPRSAALDAEFVAFLGEPATPAVWRRRELHREFDDPCRNAKIHKVLSHVYFPGARYSLWIDGSVTLRPEVSIRRLVERYLEDCDLVVFEHRLRTCVYQEASVCLERQLDDPEVIFRQMARYTAEGYPPNAGLVECPVVLRRHSPAVRAFNEAWWDEIQRGSRRDQLSFQYAARAAGLRYGTFPGSIRDNPEFHRGRHAVVPEERGGAPPAETEPERAAEERPSAPRGRRAPRAGRTRVFFGPVRPRPSWSWVGFDTARELARHYDVGIFGSYRAIPDCDVVVLVKSRPRDSRVAELRERGIQIVYCPIDVYRDAEQIARDRAFLQSCSLVVTHCERLTPLLQPFCDTVRFVDHHARFALPEMAAYKEQGYLLWIGTCQYLPYLARWLEQHPLAHELRILTNLDNAANREAARANAAAIGLPFDLSADSPHLAGHRIFRWSERRQQQMMRECRAALDVKLTGVFNQRYKPPTKAQQFVASGVPVAVNADSYSAEYFRERGFELASPLDPGRWLSREYWEATRACGEALRATTSLESVAGRYRELVESLWQPRRAPASGPLAPTVWSDAHEPR